MSAALPDVSCSRAAPAAAGISNFRDFGGLPVARGGRIVTGRLFRSAAPLGLDGASIASLGRRVSVLVDLRGSAERGPASHAGFDVAGLEVLSIPIEPGTGAPLKSLLESGTATARATRDIMIEAYRGFVRDHAGTFGSALLTVAASDRPVLVHCTAGKDRTGFLVAILQAALGADEHAIQRDYLETNAAWDRASVVGHLPLHDPAIGPVLSADPIYLEAAFDEIRSRYGSPRAFIARATGGQLSETRLDDLIEREDLP